MKIHGSYDYIPVLSTGNGVIRLLHLCGIRGRIHRIATERLHVRQDSFFLMRFGRAVVTLIPGVNLFTLLYDVLVKVMQQYSRIVFFNYGLKQWIEDPAAIENRITAAERIREVYEGEGEELDLRRLNLSSLPDVMKNLTSLKTLHIRGNSRLAALPDSLRGILGCTEFDRLQKEVKFEHGLHSWLIDPTVKGDKHTAVRRIQEAYYIRATELDLSCLGLSTLPVQIGLLSHLSVLNVSNVPSDIRYRQMIDSVLGICAQGSPVNVRLPFSLEEQQKNCFSEIPIEIAQLQVLDTLYASHNSHLCTLPLALANLMDLKVIEVEETAVPDGIAHSILNTCQQARNDTTKQLSWRLDLWKKMCELSDAVQDALNEAILHLNENQKATVNQWLRLLGKSKDFQYSQKELTKITCEMLAGLHLYPLFKEAFFNQVSDDLADCEDRTAMSLNIVYTIWKIHSLPSNVPKEEKLKLLIGVSKTLALRGALAPFVGEEKEGVEIYLYYEISLRESLGLVTAIQRMSYASIGKRNHISVEDLRRVVISTYLDHLVDLPSFKDLFQKEPAYQEFAKLDEGFQKKLERVSVENEGRYVIVSSAINKQREDAYRRIAKEWASHFQ